MDFNIYKAELIILKGTKIGELSTFFGKIYLPFRHNFIYDYQMNICYSPSIYSIK